MNFDDVGNPAGGHKGITPAYQNAANFVNSRVNNSDWDTTNKDDILPTDGNTVPDRVYFPFRKDYDSPTGKLFYIIMLESLIQTYQLVAMRFLILGLLLIVE